MALVIIRVKVDTSNAKQLSFSKLFSMIASTALLICCSTTSIYILKISVKYKKTGLLSIHKMFSNPVDLKTKNRVAKIQWILLQSSIITNNYVGSQTSNGYRVPAVSVRPCRLSRPTLTHGLVCQISLFNYKRLYLIARICQEKNQGCSQLIMWLVLYQIICPVLICCQGALTVSHLGGQRANR